MTVCFKSIAAAGATLDFQNIRSLEFLENSINKGGRDISAL